MEYVLFVLTLIAFVHFVYEGIVAPSLRMECRNQLFTQRDALRRLRIERHPESEKAAYEIIHGSINAYLTALSGVTLHYMWRLRRGIRTHKWEKETESRLHALQECGPELEIIGEEFGRILNRAFLVNSLAWAFYIVPVAAVCFALHLTTRAMTTIIAVPVDWTRRLLQREANLGQETLTERVC